MLVCGVRRKFASSHSESRYTRTGHEKRDISRIRSTFWGGGAFQERRQFRYSRLCACFRTHRSRFEQSRDDGDDRNDGDRKGVICGGRVSFGTLSGRCARHGPTVVVIDAPERDRKDLEDVERVQHLVHQEGADPLGFDFDRVRVKQGLAEGEVRLGREAVTERGDAGPGGVFPVPVAVR